MLRKLSRRAGLILAIAVLLLSMNAIPSEASDALQAWRFNVEGMT